MAVFSEIPDFSKELLTGAKSFKQASDEAKDTIKNLDKQLDGLNITQADNIEKHKELNEELKNSKLPEFFKEIKELKTNIEGVNAEIQSTTTNIAALEFEKSEAELFPDEEFKKMNASLFKISEAELERRKKKDEEFKIQKEALEALKKNNPEATTEIDRESSTIKKNEDKEQKKRDKQQTSVFSKGFKGLSNKFEDFGDKIRKSGMAALKTGLLLAVFFALAKFLQSKHFETLTKFIKEKVLPNLEEIFIKIAQFLVLLGVLKIIGVISMIAKAFMAIKVAFIAIKAAMIAASLPILPIIAVVAAIALVGAALFSAFTDAKKVFEETGSIGEAFKVGISKFAAYLLGFVPMLITKLIGFVAGLLGFDDIADKFSEMDPIQYIADKIIKPMLDGLFSFFESIMNIDFGALARKIPGAGAVMDYFGLGGEDTPQDIKRKEQGFTEGDVPPAGDMFEKQNFEDIDEADRATTKRIKDNADSITEAKSKTDIRNNSTVINSTNVNNGGAVNHSYGSRTVLDGSNEYANQV